MKMFEEKVMTKAREKVIKRRKKYFTIWVILATITIFVFFLYCPLSLGVKILLVLFIIIAPAYLLPFFLFLDFQVSLLCPRCGSYKHLSEKIPGTYKKGSWDEKAVCKKCGYVWHVHVEEYEI
jgi:rubredoxin